MKTSFVVLNILMTLTLLAWPVLAVTGVFIIAGPGASESPISWGLAYTSWFYPAPVVVGVLGSVLCWKFKQPFFVRIFTYISISPLVVSVLLLIGMYIFCSGNFACK